MKDDPRIVGMYMMIRPPRILWKIGLGIIAGLLLVILIILWVAPSELLAVQMALFTAAVSFTPTIAYHLTRRWGRIARIAVETALFTAVLVGFSVWLFGWTVLGIWLVHALVLILLLEAGSHAVERYKIATLIRLTKGDMFESLRTDAKVLEGMSHRELSFYLAVPVGMIAGTVVGLVLGWTPLNLVLFCAQLTLLLTLLVLLYFLAVAFRHMLDPLFTTIEDSPERASEKEETGFLRRFRRVLRFLVPASSSEDKDREKQDLDLAYMISGLRKVYLYDAIHNDVLLIGFVAIVLRLWGIEPRVEWLIGSLLFSSFGLNQLPYVIGQSRLHAKILERYEGTKRAEMTEKLNKYAPLFPTLDFLAALFMTGSAGGLVYFLLDRTIKDLFK